MKLEWHSANGSRRPAPAMALIPFSRDVRVQIGESHCLWAFCCLAVGMRNEWHDAENDQRIYDVTFWAEEIA